MCNTIAGMIIVIIVIIININTSTIILIKLLLLKLNITSTASSQEVRLILDKCGKANLTENISSSTMETSNCEAKATAPLQRFLLNTVAPLQLGGRWDVNNQYPTGWTKDGFRGCFRNLQHNGEVRWTNGN